TLEEALEGCLTDLDGFYTFAVGTKDGFAILRDAIACKPAVLAETDDWVAMATEYRAIATLPGGGSDRVQPRRGSGLGPQRTPPPPPPRHQRDALAHPRSQGGPCGRGRAH